MNTASLPKKGPVDTVHSPYARWRTLSLGHVRLDGGLWVDKQATNRRDSLEHGYQMLEKAGNLDNFRIAAGRISGSYRGRNFLDSDVYKWLEAIAYELAKKPDEGLQRIADETIELIQAAQLPDGYLNTYYQLVEPDNRFTDLDHGHEMYCAGHLFQGAVAYHRATGNSRLLDVARRYADHLDSVFGPDKRPGTDGHPEIEMALVELYRETGEQRYLKLAKFFIDERGKGIMRGLGWYGAEYHQDRIPVRQATEIEGHAVRAMYLMAGVTDLYMETGEAALLTALTRLWDDMTSGKLHITGGAGARYEGESFGAPYELPNDQCYCETCAAIGSVQWNWRMLLTTGEARYADLIETTLYNGFLSGVALDGRNFFYINPLLSRGGYGREEWYTVACCPPNIMRTIAAVEHHIATHDTAGIQIHLYNAATLHAEPESDKTIRLKMETDYPWAGTVRLTVEESISTGWTLSLRVPGWAGEASVQVNGAVADTACVPGSYVSLQREWQAGDVVELELAMQPTLIESHPQVDPNRGSVAIQRGPVIYCLEQHDHQANILTVQIDAKAPLTAAWNAELFGGVKTITAAGFLLDTASWGNQLYRPLGAAPDLPRQPVQLTAIPYYLWGNRGPNAMRVWIPRCL